VEAEADDVSRLAPAYYAAPSKGLARDLRALLHPPYTAWHLSYVALGAAAAPHLDGGRLGASVLAFFFAVGLSAHALDELSGRPLATRIPSRVLWATQAFQRGLGHWVTYDR